MIAKSQISYQRFEVKKRIVEDVAQKMDRKFRNCCDSCFSFLWSEYDALLGKPECSNVGVLYRALINKAHDYYRKNHTRHKQREVDQLPLQKGKAVDDSFSLDLLDFTNSLNKNEILIWKVAVKEIKGADAATELKISPQSVSAKKSAMEKRARIYFKDYEYDRN